MSGPGAAAARLRRDERDADADLAALVESLEARYAQTPTSDLLAAMIGDEFAGEIALVSSFGAEAAVLLHMVAATDPATPVIFLNTGKLFGETLRYRDGLVDRLGLRDVRSVAPDPDRLARIDPEDVLWYGNPDMCCYVRKVEPLQRALEPFAASISGRKRFHGDGRATLPLVEAIDGKIRINPLATWDKADIDTYFEAHDLPRHPLEADGFLSIGCMPCTDRVAPDEDVRAGRWRGRGKTECGIHAPRAQWRVMGID
ncbi:MAG: phosphoadenylyl-sulfate reductase [Rhodospirillales bacterium]|nr:phosphoadenylyl-sulfate reductase [Rhodospirillales bacterium]